MTHSQPNEMQRTSDMADHNAFGINSDSTIDLIMGITGKEYSLHKMRGLGWEERK
jgi:hypothetical protein